MATVTREQLQKIEWAGDALSEAEAVCPACFAAESEGEHDANCWLAAALASAPPADVMTRNPAEDMREDGLLPSPMKASAPPAAPPEDARLGVDDAHLSWRDAALRVGEELATVSPSGYYAMTQVEWRDWALERLTAVSAAPPEDARELAVARHELALIEAQTKRGVTDCSTPLPQRVQNIVEALAKAEREIKRLTAASAAPPDPPGLLSRGQARAIHIMTNVAHLRNGRVLFACDGPDCQVCADLTLLALPRALSPLAARQSDPPGLAALVAKWKATLAELSEVTKHYNYLVNVAHERVPLDVENRETAAVWAEVDARRALLAYDLSAPASPAPDWLVKAAADTRARYADGVIRGPEYIVGPPASPAPMPTIQVGDVVVLNSPSSTRDPFPRMTSEERHAAYLNGEGAPDVVAIYRDPLWRRPAPMPTKGDE